MASTQLHFSLLLGPPIMSAQGQIQPNPWAQA